MDIYPISLVVQSIAQETLLIDNTSLVDNTGAPGGAIYQEAGNITLQNSLLDSNSISSGLPNYSKVQGGAIYSSRYISRCYRYDIRE